MRWFAIFFSNKHGDPRKWGHPIYSMVIAK
jgi:hypothetical protein